ncbi:MAG: hypothetical protein ACYTXY_47875, partial [Nostoc sp.]
CSVRRDYSGGNDRKKVSIRSNVGGTLSPDFPADFFDEISRIASRIKERYDYQLKLEIAAKERTIDIQIEKASNSKAVLKLNKSKAWLKLRQERFEQCKGFLFWLGGWVGSGRSG